MDTLGSGFLDSVREEQDEPMAELKLPDGRTVSLPVIRVRLCVGGRLRFARAAEVARTTLHSQRPTPLTDTTNTTTNNNIKQQDAASNLFVDIRSLQPT